MLQVGVIGTGGMGTRHALNIANHVKEANVVGVVDADSARAAHVAAAVGAAVVADPMELINSSEIDAIVVATPDATHAPLARAAVAAAKPALIEKPLGNSSREARSVVDAEIAAGSRLIQVGLMRQFDPQHQAVEAVVVSGEIGRALAFRGWHRNPPREPRPSTHHVIFGSGVHDIHSARWLLQSDPIKVFAVGMPIDPERSSERELQLITMEMANGSLASIEINSDCGFGYEVGVEIIGSEGTVTIAPQQAPTVRAGSGAAQSMDPDWLARFEAAYVAEVVAWIDSISSDSPVGASAWDGFVSLLAADAALESIQSGRAVDIELLDRPALYAS